jgi:acyl-coenzyme A synthetase/AMP-(fatty) acid ligase
VDPANMRTALAADPRLGAGNVLLMLPEHGADPDLPRLSFDLDVDGIAAWTPLSLTTLTERVAARAEWFQRHGVVPRDPVAVYLTSAADVFLNYFALTWLGAVPALMNSNMPIEVAAEFIRRLRGVGVIIDADHDELRKHELGVPILGDATETGTGDPRLAPPHYRHHPEDPVAITHSSGTTRTPAAIVHSQHSLFAAVRAVRLTEARPYGEVRELSAMPAAHAAGIITVNQALCNGYQLLCLSAQGGPFERSGEAILSAIERWRPTGIFGFAVTWSELARYDLSTRDLSSVRNWSSTGDCAHETHIRKLIAAGSHLTYDRDEGVVRVPGSKFIDMLGSTEMGHSAFFMVHRLGTDRYDRCVGKAYPFAEVVLLDLATG